MKAKVFILDKRFEGEPKPSDVKLIEEELRPITDGEILAEAVVLSVDPYMRVKAGVLKIGDVMFGTQVAKIIESKHKDYKVGDLVVGLFGWRTHTLCNPDSLVSPFGTKAKPMKVPELPDSPPSYFLGALGMPGNTAYFGFLELCQPKSGETVVVTGAAGAVGSLVGQIARIKGCRVVGFAGSDEKVDWLKKDLKFDHAYNYKKVPTLKALEESAKGGVDCYFDNVGGTMSSEVMSAMNEYGRVSVCGAVSVYNSDLTKLPSAPVVQPSIVLKQLKVEGFIVHRWEKRWMEGIMQMKKWIDEGEIKVSEHVTKGFENMPAAFIGMLRGDNKGKAVVYV